MDAICGRTRHLQPEERPRHGHAGDPGQGRSDQGRPGRLDGGPDRAARSRPSSAPPTATTVTLDRHRHGRCRRARRSQRDHLRRRSSASCPWARSARCRSARWQTSSRPTSRAASRASTAPRGADHGRDHQPGHGQGLRDVETADRRPDRRWLHPGGRRRPPRRRDAAAERGLRRPVLVDGRGRSCSST